MLQHYQRAGIELCSSRAGTTMKEDGREREVDNRQTELVIQKHYVQLLTKIHHIGIML